jgi:DNA-directed RNA polymerase specialized sigma24 family protein
MRRYQAGDAAAFHQLFHAVSARLYRYLDMSGGEGVAEDLLQQTWLHVHRAYGKLRIELAPGDPAPEVAAGAAASPTKAR